MIVINFLKWVVKTTLLSLIFALPLAGLIFLITIVFGNGVEYWAVYKICFWGLVVIDILYAAFRTWN